LDLQELIAPQRVVFFDAVWKYISRKEWLLDTLESITGISPWALQRYDNPSEQHVDSRCSIAERMYWASKRTTTRVEDPAYCLLGLFSINMPLLYGEGARAFQRLQQAIVSSSTDTSIFAWELLAGNEVMYANNLLAPSSANFWKGSWSHRHRGTTSHWESVFDRVCRATLDKPWDASLAPCALLAPQVPVR